MIILLMHQTVTNHDAIGNDIACMYNELNKKNRCVCFAENQLNSSLTYVDKEEADLIIANVENVVIFHHSVNWELGARMIDNCKAKLIIRYHNITPPEFFMGYNDDYYSSCAEGRKLTDYFVKKHTNALWLSDSKFNCEDLRDVPAERMDICPPFHNIEKWALGKPDEELMKKLIYSSKLTVLFVGRVAPNKGHSELMDIINLYCQNFGRNIKLYVVGKFDEGIKGYNDIIHKKIRKYHLEDVVEFVGEINDATLLSYYLGSDVYLCLSEHEGFCVPIIEAQKMRLPIIAKAMCAVPETIGENQILLTDKLEEYVAALEVIKNNRGYKDYLRECGIKNYDLRFSYEKIADKFKCFMSQRVGVEV